MTPVPAPHVAGAHQVGPEARRQVWWQPVAGDDEKAAVAAVIDSGFCNDGPVTARFERAVADTVGAAYAVAVTSGTAALFLALAAAGVGPGDEVLVPDITFVATANAVRLCGATPVLVDVDPVSFCMSPAAAAAAIGARTRAMVPVHVSGRAAPMAELVTLARAAGLVVVEDAAEALAVGTADGVLGTLGDAGCLSFTANKLITTGQGGMVLTDDEGLHRRLRQLKDQGRAERGSGGPDDHPTVGYNFKFTDLQAAMGLAQLATLPERQGHQRRTLATYRRRLAGVEAVRIPCFGVEDGGCPLWVDADVDDRDGLEAALAGAGFGTRRFWLPVHTQAPYRCPDDGFPGAVAVAGRGLWLPSSLLLTDDDVEAACDVIVAWAGRRLPGRRGTGRQGEAA